MTRPSFFDRLFVFAFFTLGCFPVALAAVPQMINHQGRIAVGGINYEGNGQFKFSLVNANGSATYWSNDGSGTAGAQPANSVSLAVSKGLYSVMLGDMGLANMQALPSSVFENQDVRLRVWFNDGSHGFQLITPDQRLAAAPYALAVASATSAGNFTGSLSGDVTGIQSATAISATTVTGKSLTGFTSGAGNITASDTILSAINKLDGNAGLKANSASPTFTGTVNAPAFSGPLTGNVTGNVSGSAGNFTGSLSGDVTGTQSATAISATTVTGKAITGYVSGSGNITAADTVLTAINKLNGNNALKAPLASPTFSGTVTAPAFSGPLTGNVSGSAGSFTGSLAGDVTGTQSATAISATTVTGKAITGYVSGSGNITATDTVLGAIGKLNGNDALKAPLASPTFTGTVTAPAFSGAFTGNVSGSAGNFTGSLAGDVTGTQSATAISATTVTGKALTGYVSGAGAISASDTILSAINKLNGNNGLKADLASPTFSGTPSAPTAVATTNNTQIATTEFVKTAIGNLIGGAPAALDTLGELSAALNNDASAATNITNLLSLKAPLASPTFSGIPSAPTAVSTTNSTQIATTEFVKTAIGDVVGGAPVGLDTLSELAAALNNDPSAATNLTNALALKAPLASPTFTGTVKLPTGTNSVAPLKFATGTNLTSAVFGSVEFDGTNLYLTNNSVSPTRKTIAFTDSALATGAVGSSQLASGLTLGGTTAGTFSGPLTGNVTGNVSGSAGSFTGSLAGDVTGTQSATAISATTVTGKALTGYVSSTGAISATDTVLGAIGKLNGNDALKAPLASPTFTGTVSGITATMVGLGNVTNTSDANKPVSTAQQTALDLKANLASPTFTGTVQFPTGTNLVAPLKFATGTNLTSAVFGSVEFDGTNLYLTNNSVSPTRKTIAFTDSALATGAVGSSQLASGLTLGGTTAGAFSGPLTGNVTGNVSGSAGSFTGSLAGDVTGTQSATAISATTVTGKSLTGFASGAGNITATDTILSAINKLDGNAALKAPLASPTFTGTVTAPAFSGAFTGNVSGSAGSFTGSLAGDVTGTQSATAISATTVTGKALTGFTSGAGNITATDTVLSAINKLDGNAGLKANSASPTFSGTVTAPAFSGPLAGNVTGNVSGSAGSFTGSLAGDVTGTQSATAISATTVTGKALTGYASATGAISATDTVLGAIGKLNGNDALKAPLASPTFTGTVTAPAFSGAFTGNVSGSAGNFTGSLAGDVTGTQSATSISATTVTGKAITGYVSGSGNITATDTVLTAINKLNGNDALKAPLASPTFTGTVTAPAFSGAFTGNLTGNAGNFTGSLGGDVTGTQGSTVIAPTTVTGKALTGYVSGVGAISATDTVLTAINKLNGNDGLKAPIASPTFTGTVSGITATMVGLGNVTNTSDANKPVSTAQQAALDLKANLASPSFTGTVSLAAGTSSASPLKFVAGTNLTAPVLGSVEFDGTNLYLTNNAGTPTRKTIAFTDSALTSSVSLTNVTAPPSAPVVAWGNNHDGQTTVPTLANVAAVAAGGSHSIALLDAGTVVAWGGNTTGQTGVPATLSGVTEIAAGVSHNIVRKSDGTLVAWGDNSYGQITIPSGITTATKVAAGEKHSLALLANGSVRAWGDNGFGQTTIPSSLTGVTVTAIAAGYDHSLALTSNGTVVSWGRDDAGQVTLPGGLTNVIAIAAGAYHSLALKSDGTVVAWGWDGGGQSTIPVGLSGVIKISGGYAFSMALKSNGSVIAWGDGSDGQTTVAAMATQVTHIAAGASHAVVLRADAISVQVAKLDEDNVFTGKVGIKRTPTANALEVAGSASKTTAGSWLANSDRRIKTEVQSITGALEKLDRVRLVDFRYTAEYRTAHPEIEDRRYPNVIAQEFAKVFPDDVKSSGELLSDGSSILQVDTYPLTIYAAAAVQELHRENQKLQRENETLRHEIEAAKQRDADQEQRLRKLEEALSH